MEFWRCSGGGCGSWRRGAAAALLAGACGGGGAAVPTAPSADDPGGLPTQPPPAADTTAAPRAPVLALFDTPDKYFVPTEVTIAAGGTVTWRASDNSHEIRFEGAAPPGGDIPFLKEGQSATRTFPSTGTYRFRCDRHDDVGVVFVVGPGSPPPDTTATPAGVTVTTPGVSFSPSVVTIRTGEAVTWQITGIRHNVVFRGAAPQGGNIPDTDPGRSVSRTFIAPGTYDYDCTRHTGMSGRVVVQ
jgi:plastocyanin